MSKSAFIVRGIALACALGAASLPALAQNPTKQSGPARWYKGDSTKQQRTATLKKEINAAYAEQQSACRHESSGQRSACLKQARQTYQHDMAHIPQLLAAAPSGGVNERVVSTTTGMPDTPAGQGGASAYGSSGGGATGSGSGTGSVDAIPPNNGQAGGMPPPIDQPNPVQPMQPPQTSGANPPPSDGQ